MSESEARTLTSTFPQPVKSSAEHQVALEEIDRQKQTLDELQVRTFGLPEREVWHGKGYELALKVRGELGDDWRKPGRLTAALEQACRKYVQANGRRFNVKSLREGLRQVDDKEAGR